MSWEPLYSSVYACTIVRQVIRCYDYSSFPLGFLFEYSRYCPIL